MILWFSLLDCYPRPPYIDSMLFLLLKGRTVNWDLRLPLKTACAMTFFLSIMLLCDCASRPSPHVVWTHPELLYLQNEPYARLYVEIDRMEGVNLSEHLVDELKAFLGKYCLKRDGIEVVLDTPIPMSEFEGIGLNSASILCIDGPIADGRPQPAYLHLFVYDGKTMFKRTMRNPRVVSTGPSSIFWNVDFARSWPDATKIDTLRHELGHVLGLCRNTAHGDGSHCRKYGCLMHWMPDWASQLGGAVHLYSREHHLCDDCEQDLALARQGPPDDTLLFAGPFLVRTAEGYCVASLPFYDTIIGTPTPTGFDWKKALRQAKMSIREGSIRDELDRGRDPGASHADVWGSLYDRPKAETCPERLAQDIAILRKALDDPSPSVRRMASVMLRIREDTMRSLHR
jgi:hypothetical protein